MTDEGDRRIDVAVVLAGATTVILPLWGTAVYSFVVSMVFFIRGEGMASRGWFLLSLFLAVIPLVILYWIVLRIVDYHGHIVADGGASDE